MANYGLKYFKETPNYRLEILEKGYMGLNWEIGTLAGLSVEVNSGGDDITAPIIKTYCNISIVDAWDIPTANGVKYGRWEEFYTPDAFKYKVVLYGASSDEVRWVGYITPDAWEESLYYHGTITITARDNIGYLENLPFDWDDDIIELGEILNQSSYLAGQETFLVEDRDISYIVLDDNGNQLPSRGISRTCFNAAVFRGGTWYNALETALKSLGMVLRYSDPAIREPYGTDMRYHQFYCVTLMNYSIRQNEEIELPIAFVETSGYRTLKPPFKELVTSVQFEEASADNEPLTIRDFGQVQPFPQLTGGYNIVETFSEGCHLISDGVANAGGGCSVTWKPMTASKIAISFYGRTRFMGCMYDPSPELWPVIYPARLSYLISCVWTQPDGTRTYYDYSVKQWQSVAQPFSVKVGNNSESDPEYIEAIVEIVTPPYAGVLTVNFINVNVDTTSGSYESSQGIYAGISSVNYGYSYDYWRHSRKVTTKYLEEANKRESIALDIAHYATEPKRATGLKNAFLSDNVEFGNRGMSFWKVMGEREPYSDFQVILHKWLLCFNGQHNSVLTGDCVVTSGAFRFSSILTYFNRRFRIISGRYNYITGILEGATLREWQDYNDLWESKVVETETDVH